MEQNFQTSFIPKKPIIEERVSSSRSIGLFAVVSIFVLFTTLLMTGGVYFYKGILVRSNAKMENDLNLAKARFEPSKITELHDLDKRLNSASDILSKHIAITPIFNVLEGITMKTVRYTEFSYELGNEQDSRVKVMLEGQAVGYRSVALQSDLFAGNKNLIDPVFSNLTLDDDGNVKFSLEFLVDPSFVDYRQMLQIEGDTFNNMESSVPGESSLILPAEPIEPIADIP